MQTSKISGAGRNILRLIAESYGFYDLNQYKPDEFYGMSSESFFLEAENLLDEGLCVLESFTNFYGYRKEGLFITVKGWMEIKETITSARTLERMRTYEQFCQGCNTYQEYIDTHKACYTKSQQGYEWWHHILYELECWIEGVPLVDEVRLEKTIEDIINKAKNAESWDITYSILPALKEIISQGKENGAIEDVLRLVQIIAENYYENPVSIWDPTHIRVREK